ncbi:MAG TPA: DUF167 family protein [Methanoregula sp.]|nr:DUF167 family protein [Methanoregula sp.]
MPGFADAFSEDRSGTVVAIEVSAGAKTSAFPAGYNAWRKALVCRVTAPAIEGRANQAISRLVARALGVPVSSVVIVSGTGSSRKRVLVTGLTREEALARLGDIS